MWCNSCFPTRRATQQQCVPFYTNDYNQQKEQISDMEGTLDLDYKDTMWQGATEILSEKLDELIGR